LSAVPIDLGRRLITAGVVPPEEVEAALFLSIVRGIPFARALVDRGALTERVLEEELERRGGLALRNVVGVPELVARLPRAMCRRLCAIPTRLDPYTGTVDVAAADPIDPHIAVEFGFHLGAPIRIIRALLTAVEEAIRRVELGDIAAAPRVRRATPAFPHGAPDSTQPPPPPLDEVPIPLVRRVGVALVDPDNDEPLTTRHRSSDTFEAPPIPLRQLKTMVSERPVLPIEAAPSASRAAASKSRLMILYDPAEQPVAISFPSAPPPPTSSPPSPKRVEATPSDPERGPPAADEGGIATVRLPSGSRAEVAAAPRAVTAHPIVPLGEEITAVVGRIVDVPTAAPSSRPHEPISSPMSPSSRANLRAADTVRLPHAAPRPTAAAAPPAGDPEAVHAASSQRQAQPGSSGPTAARGLREGALSPAEGPPPLPFADALPILQKLHEASARDEVVRLTLRGLRLIARRIALFVVKLEGFQGWACNAEFGEETALRGLVVPHDQPSILATATATTLYLGPIPHTPAHAALLEVMGHASSDVAAIAVRAGNRPAMVLLADQLGDPMLGTRRMDELAKATGAALSRLLAARE
jgi:hypothetical protein